MDGRTDGRTDERSDGRTDGRLEGRMNGRTADGETVGRTDGRTDRRTDGRSEGQTDERSEGRTDEQTDGRSEGRTDGRSDGRTGGRLEERTDITPKPKVDDKVLESLKNKIKKMYEKRDSFFQPTQTKFALKNFAIQYRIKVSNGYDPESFLLNSKEPITNLIINTRQTKDKLIISCMMVKVDLNRGVVIAKEAAFILKQNSTYKVLTLTNCFRKWNKLF